MACNTLLILHHESICHHFALKAVKSPFFSCRCFSFLNIFIAKCCQGVFHCTTFYNPCLISTRLQLMKRHTATGFHMLFTCFPGSWPFIPAGCWVPSSSALWVSTLYHRCYPQDRTASSRCLPHFLFWHQDFGFPCFGPFTPVAHISYSSVVVIKHHDEKCLMEESWFQVTVPGGKPKMADRLGNKHCGRCRNHRDHVSVWNGKQRVNETKLSKVSQWHPPFSQAVPPKGPITYPKQRHQLEPCVQIHKPKGIIYHSNHHNCGTLHQPFCTLAFNVDDKIVLLYWGLAKCRHYTWILICILLRTRAVAVLEIHACLEVEKCDWYGSRHSFSWTYLEMEGCRNI